MEAGRTAPCRANGTGEAVVPLVRVRWPRAGARARERILKNSNRTALFLCESFFLLRPTDDSSKSSSSPSSSSAVLLSIVATMSTRCSVPFAVRSLAQMRKQGQNAE